MPVLGRGGHGIPELLKGCGVTAPLDPPPVPLGDESLAARDLLDRYLARLKALAASRLSPTLKRRLDPEDIVLSAFRSYFVGARAGKWELSPDADLWSLLATLTLRKLARQARRHRSEKRSVLRETETPDDWSPPAREVPTAEEAVLLADELEWLVAVTEGLDREILVRQLRGDESTTIARELEVSERTVRRSQQRTRELVSADRSHAELAQRMNAVAAPRDPTRPMISAQPTRSLSELMLHEMVGQGAFSKVFRATDRQLGRTVAVKFLKKSAWSDANAVASFLREYDSLRAISHPCVLPVYGWGRTDRGAVFLVVEWVDGKCLAEWPPPHAVREVVRIGLALAEGLMAAHAVGVWHCDLTPANVVMTSKGDCRLVDFGMARWGASDDSPRGGTAGFLAPEQVNPGFGPISDRTDVYGLGGLLYSLLTGEAPCAGRDLPETITRVLSPDLPTDLSQWGVAAERSNVIMRSLHKSPAARWEDMERFATALRGLLVTRGS